MSHPYQPRTAARQASAGARRRGVSRAMRRGRDATFSNSHVVNAASPLAEHSPPRRESLGR